MGTILTEWSIGVEGFDVTELSRLEALLAQGTGYLGLRSATDERYVEEERRFVVASVFDTADGPHEVSEAVALPDVTVIDVTVDGDRVAFDRGAVDEYRRVLHLGDGRLVTEASWSAPRGTTVRWQAERVTSLADPHVLTTRIRMRTDRDVRVVVDSGIDGTATNAGVQHLHERHRACDGRTAVVHDRTSGSDVDVVLRATTTVMLDGQAAAVTSRRIGRRSVAMRTAVELAAGTELVIEKVATVHTSRDPDDTGDVVDRATAAHQRAVDRGHDELVVRSAEAWAAFWGRADVEITADDPRDQLAVRHALYHLRCMTSQDDDRVGIGAKGMTGEGYRGHSFWDTEVYVLPVWTHVDPATAGRLLRYRVHGLAAAHEWAATNGYAGAMIPWEAAWPADGDATPTRGGLDVVTGEREVIDTGTRQHHISAIVGHAIDAHVAATGDRSILDEGGLTLLCALARFWADRVEGPDEDGALHVTGVIGPDEYSIGVDDNTFTNALARRVLRLAARHAEEAGRVGHDDTAVAMATEVASWRATADRLVVHAPDEDGVIDQDTTFRSLPPIPDLEDLRAPDAHALDHWSLGELSDYQVAKQADVVALLLLDGDGLGEDVHRANLAYYEPRTIHDSSLSAPTHCVVAARAGLDDLAAAMWSRSREVDIGPRSGVASGVHAAALAGIWQCVVLGFAGITLRDGEVSAAPRLPAGWSQVRVRLTTGDGPVIVTVAGSHVTVEPVDDEHRGPDATD